MRYIITKGTLEGGIKGGEMRQFERVKGKSHQLRGEARERIKMKTIGKYNESLPR